MNKKIIFVDCFNTVVLRKKSPQDVLYDWAKQLGQHYQIEPSMIYKLFNRARRNLAIKKLFKYHYTELRFDEIVLYIANSLIKNKSEIEIDDFCKTATNYYIFAEKQSHYANYDLIKELIEYKKQGSKIYIVSDFYCTKDIIGLWLKNLNIYKLFDNIFVSCDYKRTKSSGALYSIVCKTLKANKKDILMIGDNKWSDNLSARLRGINAKHIKTKEPSTQQQTKDAIKHGNNYQQLKDIFNNTQDKYNLSNYAFPLFLFTKRLYKNLKQNNVNNVMFLSREGQFLKTLFDKYCELIKQNNTDDYASKVKTHYFYASRNSVLNATLKDINEEDFKYLFRASHNMSAQKFLQTLNFSEDEIKQIKQTFEYDIEKRIHKFGKSKTFNALKNNNCFVNIYNKKRKDANYAFGEYLKTFNIDFEKEGMFIVDIGYKGTMQALISQFFDNQVNITGYYMGNKKSKFDIYPTQKRFGILYEQNNKSLYAEKITKYQVYQYEQICRADHNSCDTYKIINNEPTVVFNNNTLDVAIFEKLTFPLQKQILEKFERIAMLDYFNCNYYEHICAYMYYKLIKNKTKDDWQWIMESQETHHDNFGDARYPFKIIGKNLRLFGFKLLDKLFLLFVCIYAKKIKNDYIK